MSGTNSAQAVTPGNWITQTINGMQYQVLLPANYDPLVKYATTLYLHQLDMGNDPSGLLAEVNPWFNTTAFRTATPTIVVMPLLDQSADPSGQTINFGGISTGDTAGETNAIAALKQVMSQYSVDTSRVYVTGNSMGGIGTEDMLIKYNAYTGTEGKLFAAGLSLAGADYGQGYPTPNASVVTALKNVPFWAIHGGQDTQVPLTFDQNLYAAEQAAGGDMKFTQDNNLGHDVWDTYYPQSGANSPLGWLFSQSTGGKVSSPTPTPTPSAPASANDTVVTGTTGSITDASGNRWTITAGGQVAINGTADTTTAGVAVLAYVNGTIWQENNSKLWWGETTPNASWAPSAGTTTSPLPVVMVPTPTPTPVPTPTPAPTPTPVPTPTPTPIMAGTRDPSQIPFASDSIFNLPLGSGAQWQANAQLSGSTAYINTPDYSGYNENIYTGTASDPVVTITNNAGAGGSAGSFQVHIPVGAIPAGGGDMTFSVDDTTTHTWYSFGGFQWTGANTATVNQGSGESDFGSGIAVAGSDWDEGAGTLRASDLKAGSIDHMLRMELPTDMLMSYSSSAYTLAPYAWPQNQEDGFGPSVYTGTIPYGVTIGIPASAVEPAAVKANAGANMLWNALQHHGAMVRDSGGSGNTVIFQTDQQVSGGDPLIQGMEQLSAQIMAATRILVNQGPNSINGGGTPIVPLDAPLSDAPATPTPTPTPTPVPTPTPTPTGTPSANDTVVKAASGSAITDANGNKWTITAGGQVAINGVADTTTAQVTELAYVNGTIWQENASNLWWGEKAPNGSWAPAAGTATSPLPATPTPTPVPTPTPTPTPVPSPSASANDTMVLAGSSAAITDAGGNKWTITSGGQVAFNGAADTSTANVAELAYVNNAIWQENASNLWWDKTSPSGSWTAGASPLPQPIIIPGGTTSATVSQSQVSVVATAGSHMLFLGGSGDIVSLSGGTERISETGHGNTFILPAAGKGIDIFNNNILTKGDTLDLKTALAATDWNGSASTVSNYLTVTDSAVGATLSIAAMSGGTGVAIATIDGATTATLASVLAHSFT